MKLNLKEFKHNKIQLSNVIFTGELKNKVINLDRAETKIFGGKAVVKGSIGVDESFPSFGISLLLNNVNINPLINVFTKNDTMDGKLFFSGVLRALGQSPSQWVRSLESKGKISTRNVSFDKFDLNKIIGSSVGLYSVIDMDAIINEATASGETIFDSIDGQFDVSKAVLSAKDFNLATKSSRGLFAGNISLENLQMKGIAKLGFRPEVRRAVELRISFDGPLYNIAKNIDTSDLERYIVEKGRR